MKRVTVLDVARHAGVSQGTVSRVLTGKNWVSDEARLKVEAAVRALSYVPNAMAQSFKAQRTNTVAALVSDMSNPLHGEFLAAAEEQFRAAGYLLLVANTQSRTDQDLALLSAFRSGRVDGLIVAHSNEQDQATLKALQDASLPIVFHDRESAGLGDSVLVDHRAGSYTATKHLLDLGHRRIAVLTPPSLIRPGRERMAGYQRALQEFGVKIDMDLVRELGASSELSYSEVKSLVDLPDPPTAIICLGTRMLAGVLSALTACDLKVPEHVSLIGIGDTDLLRLYSPPITSVRWDIVQCGRIAAKLLLERIESSASGKPLPLRLRHVPVEFVARQSTAQPFRRDAALAPTSAAKKRSRRHA
jgi:LacI family transcriptional regulator